jgi:hypothetical protein
MLLTLSINIPILQESNKVAKKGDVRYELTYRNRGLIGGVTWDSGLSFLDFRW